MNKILVIAGPSAVGKTTVMNEILNFNEKFEYIRSATTRAPRGDKFDSEYIYLSKDEFRLRIENGGVLEYTEYGGNFYGTPKSEIERIFSDGKIPVLILDLNGVKTLKTGACDFSVFAVYITAEREVLEIRLHERLKSAAFTDEARAVFEKRKAQNLADEATFLKMQNLFDLVTPNNDVCECASKIVLAFSNC